MTIQSNAVETAVAYFRAWTTQGFDAAGRYIDPGIVCDTPAGRLTGEPAFRAFMEPFTRLVQDADLLAAYGDDDRACVVYDTRTGPVASAPGAELVSVTDGRITHMRIIFDRLPFEIARQAAG